MDSRGCVNPFAVITKRGDAAMFLRHTAMREGRLLSFLRRELGLSYHLTKRLKYREAYRVNGVAAHTNHLVSTGDAISVEIEEDTPAYEAQHGELSIVYEDDALIVLDKPAGIIVHPTFNRTQGTLANHLLGYYQRTGQRSAIHFVNRLDRDTFGVMLIAKNAHVHAILCDRMRQGLVQKRYEAIVFGHPAAMRGAIEHPIARLSPQSLLRCVRADGKPAETRYSVLHALPDSAVLSLTPVTGRTHQLRVHCAHEGFPILGDCQYGSEASQAYSSAHGIFTHQLCAVSLAFAHPLTGKEVIVHTKQAVGMPHA